MQFNRRPISLYEPITCLRGQWKEEQQILPGLQSAQSYATSHAHLEKYMKLTTIHCKLEKNEKREKKKLRQN